MMFKIPEKVQHLGVDIYAKELRYHRYRVLVSKEFTFDSAHHLHNYEGKCKNLHGHTYKVIFGISSFTDDNGLSLDFAIIKKLWQTHIEPIVDHKYLNESLPKMNTTAENMVVWIFEQMHLQISLCKNLTYLAPRLEFVRLYETPTAYAEFRREFFLGAKLNE